MEQDVNNEQVVTALEDANNEQVVTAQDETGPVHQEEQSVPYDRFKEVNEAKKAAEEARLHAERQLELLQMQQAQTAQQPVAPQTTYEQAMAQLGLTADDLYGENIVKVNALKDRMDQARLQQQTQAQLDQQFVQSHPDARQVVGTANLMGQFIPSAELGAILTEKPYLAGACQTVQGAYELVMQERELKKLKAATTVTQEHLARKNVDIATQPIGGSAAGGGSGGTAQGSGLLSREQMLEIDAKLAAGERL